MRFELLYSKMPRSGTALLFLLLFGLPLMAQQPDTVRILQDTTLVAADTTGPAAVKKRGGVGRFFSKNYPDPKKALLFSIIPGGGQLYNKKWWKLPLVYGAIGVSTYFVIDNSKFYRKLRDNYKWQVDTDPDTNPTEEPFTLLDPTSTRKYRDQWLKFVEWSYMALGFSYLLSATDAFVDAHLASFDVSDDLSLRMKPSVQTGATGQPAFGIGFSLYLVPPKPSLIPANSPYSKQISP